MLYFKQVLGVIRPKTYIYHYTNNEGYPQSNNHKFENKERIKETMKKTNYVRNSFQKLLCLALAFVLMLGTMPSVFAEEGDAAPTVTGETLQEDVATDGEEKETELTDAKKEEATDPAGTIAEETPTPTPAAKTEPADITTGNLNEEVSLSRSPRDANVDTSFADIVDGLQVTVAIDGNLPTQITNADSVTISVNDTLIVTYNFTISADKAEVIKDSISSNTAQYLMTFPAWLDIDPGSTELKTTGTDGQQYKYADIIVAPDGKVYIQFAGDFWENDQNYLAGLDETTIELHCTIKEEEFLESSTQQLEFDGGFHVTVKVEENEPKEATLEKAGRYDTSLNRFVWTVTYTPGNGKVILPLTLTDTYDNFSLNEYDEGSFGLKVTKKDGTTVTVASSNYNLTSSAAGDKGVVTCILNDRFFMSVLGYTDITDGVSLDGYVFEFTYQTKLTTQAFLLDKNTPVEVENIAVLEDADTLSLEADAVASVSPQNLSLVTKKACLTENGTFVDSATTTGLGTQDFVWWQVEFSTLDLNLKNLILYDEKSRSLILDESTFTLTDNLGNKYGYADLTITSTTVTENEKTYDRIAITIPELDGGGYATNYTLKYKTTVDPSLFLPTEGNDGKYTFTSAALTNKAWLTFNADGAGPLIELPIVSKPVTVTTNIIQKDKEYTYNYPYDGKTVSGYQYNARTVRWTLRVNPYHVYVDDGATITDTIPAGLTYDETYKGGSGTSTQGGHWNGLGIVLYKKNTSGGADVNAVKNTDFTVTSSADSYILNITGKDKPITLSGFQVTPNEDETSTMSCKIDGLEDYRLAFYFYTTINDEKIADNKTTSATRNTFVNNVTFDCEVAATSEGPFSKCAPKVNATVYVYSLVLEKNGKSYDNDTNEITWEVTVNHNNITMPDTVLYETIPEYQEYVPGSVFIGSSKDPLTEYGSNEDASDAKAPYTVYNETDRILTIVLGDLDSRTTVTFKTAVDVDKYVDAKGNTFTNSKTVTVDNKIYLDNKYKSNIEASGNITITNDILTKTGTTEGTGLVSYYININPNKLDLTNQELSDMMPAGLELDPGSVKLYEVTVTDGKFPTVASLTEDSLLADWKWSYDEDTRDFTIILPGSDSYILVYDCYVTDSTLTSADNTISFKGDLIVNSISSVKTTTHNICGASFFSALDNSLTIYKVDTVHTGEDDESPIPIEGVNFELYYYSSISGNEVVYRTGITDSDGKITFQYLPLNRKFYLRETGGGSGYDDTPVYLNFESDPKDAVTWEYDENEENYAIVFTTKTAAAEITCSNDPYTTTIEFLKHDDKGGNVTGVEFVLTGITNDDGVTTNYTKATMSAAGTVKFEDVPWGTYSLQEISAPSGYTIDSTVYTVIVDPDGSYVISYYDPEDEAMVPVYDSNEANEKWAVENIYTASGSIVLRGTKELDGRDWFETDKFSFVLTETTTSESSYTDTVQSDTNGNIVFTKIEYTLDDIGEHIYTIKEVNGGSRTAGVTYDNTVRTVKVNVTDNHDGTLNTAVEYPQGGVVFTNIYSADSTEVTLTGTKTLENKTQTNKMLEAGMFSFEVKDQNGNTAATGTNDADGTITFSTITYTDAGTYTYTVTEVNGGAGGIGYDSTEHTVTVHVTDNLEGQLEAKVEYPENGVVFNNTYTAESTTISLTGTKELADNTLTNKKLEAGMFSFEIKDQDHVVVATGTNNADGQITFGDIGFTAPGTYTYTVSEIQGQETWFAYDSTIYTVTVEVTDDGEGQLRAEVKTEKGGEPADDILFVNTYQPEIASVEFDAEKLLLGRDLRTEEFQFELKQGGIILETVSNDEDGRVTFSEITYDKVGTYVYTISEKQGSLKRVVYDESIFTVTVEVADVDHVLIPTVSYTKDDEEQDAIFINKFKPTVMDEEYYNNLEVLKSADKTEAAPGDTITYTITAENTGDVEKEELIIKDYLPKYTTFVSSQEGTLMKDSAGEYVEWTIDYLAPGEKMEFTFSVKVTKDAPNGHKIENTAIYGNEKTTETVTTVVKSVQGDATVTPIPKSTVKSGIVKNSSTAKTGDTTQWLFWILLILAGAGIIVFLLYKKGKNFKK